MWDVLQYQMAVCRLELPRDALSNSSKFSSELFLTAHIFSNQVNMHDVSMRFVDVVGVVIVIAINVCVLIVVDIDCVDVMLVLLCCCC